MIDVLRCDNITPEMVREMVARKPTMGRPRSHGNDVMCAMPGCSKTFRPKTNNGVSRKFCSNECRMNHTRMIEEHRENKLLHYTRHTPQVRAMLTRREAIVRCAIKTEA